MAELELTFEGGQTAARTSAALREIERARPSDILPQLNRSLHEIERRQFYTFGVFGGTPWPPLSPAYALWKAIHFPGAPLLRRTNAMYAAATVTSTAVGFGNSVLITIADRKVEWHQHGTAGRVGNQGHVGHMPARPVLPVASVERIWTNHWRHYLKGLARNADHATPVPRLAVGAFDPLGDF